MSGERRLARGSLAAVALAVCAIVLIVGSSSSAATNADFTGHWSLVDHATGGPNKGNDYPWEGDWTQSGSELTGTGGYSIAGSVSGSTASFKTTSGGAYVATFELTMSADGKSLTGTASDTQGQTFSVTGSGAGKPATSETPPPSTPPPPKTASPKLEPLPDVDPDKATGRVLDVKGPNFTVIRDGKRYTASKNSQLQSKDVIVTGKNTTVAVEFLIGGRVGVNANTRAEMVNERSAATDEPLTRSIPKLILETGKLVVPFGHWPGDPIEIQTNGGTLGVKG